MEINLELVTFDQAKSLKELGFPQLYEYTLDKQGNREFKIQEYLVPYAFDEQGNATVDRWNTKTYSCIPLELVAKWLREEKNIQLTVRFRGKKWYYDIMSGYEILSIGNAVEVYEQALSAGIDKAIEILNKEKNEKVLCW